MTKSQPKSERIHMRLHPGTKARWLGVAQSLGYRDLSKFIMDTIEQTHFPDGAVLATVLPFSSEGPGADDALDNPAVDERAGDSVDEPENEVAPGASREPISPEPATPAHPVGGEPVAPVRPRRADDPCPNLGRFGTLTFCKQCKRAHK